MIARVGTQEILDVYEKQAATALLNKEGELISKLAHEGMITHEDAEIDLKRVINDIVSIEKQRKKLTRSVYYLFREHYIQ